MSIEQLQTEIEALSPQDYVCLREWFAEKDWQDWDRQVEADSGEGKLDFLIEEAMNAKAKGALEDL